jgi:ribosomal protein S27E
MQHRTHLHIPADAPHAPVETTVTLPATAYVPVRCPNCQEETFTLPGSLCERCNPENTALLPDRAPMQARCHTCKAVVTKALLRQSADLEQVTLLSCPACGVLWCSTNPYRSASRGVVWEPLPTPGTTEGGA